MIRWFAKNGIAANFLMLGLLLAGIYPAYFRIPLEVTPTLSWETVMIEMPYRGATAKDVERFVKRLEQIASRRRKLEDKRASLLRRL